MKKSIAILLLLVGTTVLAQNKVITKKGTVLFEASVPSFEEVKAKSESATLILNTETGEIASLVLMKSFRFKIALMEEHFNESYIESDVYPKSSFKGKIENFDIKKLTSSDKEFTINGKIELHGKSKDISIKAKMKKTDQGISITSNFQLNSDDFDIKIPSVVSKKVVKKVDVRLDATLK
jgi:hypothetical protein